MRYLIDTHVLLWSLSQTRNLSDKAKEILESENVLVSVVSWWELSIKFGLGKIELQLGTPEDLLRATQKMNYGLLPLSAEEASGFHQLARIHKDPFDRMLVWQAIKNDVTLVSKDSRLISYAPFGLQLIW